MKLLFLYGPPAAGKLTVAHEISRLTGFKLFDNHRTIDLTKEIFPNDSQVRLKLVERLRLDVIEAAAQEGINLIFTLVYAQGDEVFIDEIVRLVEKHHGTVCFVQLAPTKDTLLVRVDEPSRKAYTKIQSSEILRRVLYEHDLYATISNHESLTIDNTNLPVAETARTIINHFGLDVLTTLE